MNASFFFFEMHRNCLTDINYNLSNHIINVFGSEISWDLGVIGQVLGQKDHQSKLDVHGWRLSAFETNEIIDLQALGLDVSCVVGIAHSVFPMFDRELAHDRYFVSIL